VSQEKSQVSLALRRVVLNKTTNLFLISTAHWRRSWGPTYDANLMLSGTTHKDPRCLLCIAHP
jgi:hypothetical protein